METNAIMPYRISKATIEINGKDYPIINLHTDEIQQKLFGVRLFDTLDIDGIGELEIIRIYCYMDNEQIERFNRKLDFRHYIFKCERLD